MDYSNASLEHAVDNDGSAVYQNFPTARTYLHRYMFHRLARSQHLQVHAFSLGDIDRGRPLQDFTFVQAGQPGISGIDKYAQPLIVHHRNGILCGVNDCFQKGPSLLERGNFAAQAFYFADIPESSHRPDDFSLCVSHRHPVG